MNQLRNINGSQAQEKVTDLTQAFPDIADLPSAPYNSQFRRLFQKPRTNTDPIRRRLKNILPRRITYTKEEMHERMDEFLHHQPPEDVSPAVDKLARFLVAFAGGASLVVPMLVMTLAPSLTCSLITTSVSVLFCAAGLSLSFGASNTETLAATSAYAAVLVVFVGTSGRTG